MKNRFTATGLRANLYRVLDRVLETGRPVEIERKGRILRIQATEADDRLANLPRHPEFIAGDAESLVHLDWSDEWKP